MYEHVTVPAVDGVVYENDCAVVEPAGNESGEPDSDPPAGLHETVRVTPLKSGFALGVTAITPVDSETASDGGTDSNENDASTTIAMLCAAGVA